MTDIFFDDMPEPEKEESEESQTELSKEDQKTIEELKQKKETPVVDDTNDPNKHPEITRPKTSSVTYTQHPENYKPKRSKAKTISILIITFLAIVLILSLTASIFGNIGHSTQYITVTNTITNTQVIATSTCVLQQTIINNQTQYYPVTTSSSTQFYNGTHFVQIINNNLHNPC